MKPNRKSYIKIYNIHAYHTYIHTYIHIKKIVTRIRATIKAEYKSCNRQTK